MSTEGARDLPGRPELDLGARHVSGAREAGPEHRARHALELVIAHLPQRGESGFGVGLRRRRRAEDPPHDRAVDRDCRDHAEIAGGDREGERLGRARIFLGDFVADRGSIRERLRQRARVAGLARSIDRGGEVLASLPHPELVAREVPAQVRDARVDRRRVPPSDEVRRAAKILFGVGDVACDPLDRGPHDQRTRREQRVLHAIDSARDLVQDRHRSPEGISRVQERLERDDDASGLVDVGAVATDHVEQIR